MTSHLVALVALLLLGGCHVERGADADASADLPRRAEASADQPAARESSTPSSLDECFADIKQPATGFVELQDFRTSDERYRLRQARQPGNRTAAGETFPYDLIRFGLLEVATHKLVCVRDAAALAYDFGHHNWDETAAAVSGGVRYVVRMQIVFAGADMGIVRDMSWQDTLTLRRAEGDQLLEGPLALVEAGCRTLPFDLNPCFRRTRTDQE